MSTEFDLVSTIKTAAEKHLPNLEDVWDQIWLCENRKRNQNPAFNFLYLPLILIFLIIVSFFSQSSSNFSTLLSIILLGLHAILKLNNSPVPSTRQYQTLYSCLLALCILFCSSGPPLSQAKIFLAALFPLYFQILTLSLPFTFFISLPVLSFLFCSSSQESFPTAVLAAMLIAPTVLWSKMAIPQQQTNQDQQQSFPDVSDNKISLEATDKVVSNYSENYVPPEEKSPERPLERKNSDTITAEEHEKVILGISHDCRNLLNSLKATLTSIKDELSGDETMSVQDDNLQSAIAITEHLILLFTNLLDYLKKKNDEPKLQEEMRLTTTLEKIWLMISPNLKKKKLDGSITIKNGTPLSVYLDEHKFMGILLNLIGNASKFTDTGHIKLNVHWKEANQKVPCGSEDAQANIPIPAEKLKKPEFATSRAVNKIKTEKDEEEQEEASVVLSRTAVLDLKDINSISFTKKCFTVITEANTQINRSRDGILVVSVRDTGCGIDDESLKKLFRKYAQVGKDKEKQKLGLGLGLWYTKYLLNKLNGKIDFRSAKEVGTWVKIEIPCKATQKGRESYQTIKPDIQISSERMDYQQKTNVFIRENDKLGSFLMSEYLHRHLSGEINLVEIKTISEILCVENYAKEPCILILGENSATKQEIQALKMLYRLNQSKKVAIILLREATSAFGAGENAWDNMDIDYIVKKPIRHLQLEHIAMNIEAIRRKNLARGSVGKLKDEVAHVLIVDDDKATAQFLQKCLKKCGIQCFVAEDGCEALDTYKKEHLSIKMILMDSEMPKMNGVDATKAIRAIATNQDLKIVGLTGDDSEDFFKQAKEVGMNEVFVKPIPFEKLLHIVNKVLG